MVDSREQCLRITDLGKTLCELDCSSFCRLAVLSSYRSANED